MTSRICLVALVVCLLAAFVAAGPARNDHARGRKHYPSAASFAGARAHHVPADAEESEEADEPQEDELQHDDEEEQEATPTPVKPRATRPRARPAADEAQQGGATAVANSVSRGAGAVSNSRAAAYGGRFAGGRFGQH